MTSKKEQLERRLKQEPPLNFRDIWKELKIKKSEAVQYMDELKNEGLQVESYLDENYQPNFYIHKGTKPTQTLELLLRDGEHLMGLTSDIHVGDAAFREASFNDFYDNCDDEGVEFILCAGDIITGIDVYRSQHADLNIHTKWKQMQYVIDNLPSLVKGETYFITGNHDLKNLAKGFDPGIRINDKKKGWTYLGQYLADIKIAGGLTARLNHLSGHPYSRSYRAQKYLRELKPVDMPDILCLGHAHTIMYMIMQGVHVFECGTFQGENTYTKHHGLENSIGAWIVKYVIKNGKLESLTPELKMYD